MTEFDIIVNLKRAFRPVYVQVKSRFILNKNKHFVQNVGLHTFKSHPSFYIIFMYFTPDDLEVATVWLIPSEKFEELAYPISEGKSYRFSANPKSDIDKWAQFKVNKASLGEELLRICPN